MQYSLYENSAVSANFSSIDLVARLDNIDLIAKGSIKFKISWVRVSFH
jgi:hypothetical protein